MEPDPGCHEQMHLSLVKKRKKINKRLRNNSQVERMGRGGARRDLAEDPHWQKLGGHHVGVIEVEDSQELQI